MFKIGEVVRYRTDGALRIYVKELPNGRGKFLYPDGHTYGGLLKWYVSEGIIIEDKADRLAFLKVYTKLNRLNP